MSILDNNLSCPFRFIYITKHNQETYHPLSILNSLYYINGIQRFRNIQNKRQYSIIFKTKRYHNIKRHCVQDVEKNKNKNRYSIFILVPIYIYTRWKCQGFT